MAKSRVIRSTTSNKPTTVKGSSGTKAGGAVSKSGPKMKGGGAC